MSLLTSGLDEEARERLEAAREVAVGITEQFPRSYLVQCRNEGRPTTEMWEALGKSGLLGLRVPSRYGGSDGSLTDMVAVIETLATAGVPNESMMLNGFARIPILEHGSEEQIEKWVRPTTDGSQKLCLALTEPDAGTNTFKIRTRAKKTDSGWELSGQKVFISGALESDSTVVLARTDTGNDKPELSLFVLDSSSEGIECSLMDVHTMSNHQQYTVFFDQVSMPDDALIGVRGKGLNYLFDGLNPERILAGALAVGLGEHVLAKGVDYARERAPFGTPIGSYQGIQHPLAEAKAKLVSARLMVYEAAVRFERGDEAGPYSTMAKYLASHAAAEAVDIAIQAHGGSGFDLEYDVISFWPMIRLLQVAPINNEMALSYIGQHVLGLGRSH